MKKKETKEYLDLPLPLPNFNKQKTYDNRFSSWQATSTSPFLFRASISPVKLHANGGTSRVHAYLPKSINGARRDSWSRRRRREAGFSGRISSVVASAIFDVGESVRVRGWGEEGVGSQLTDTAPPTHRGAGDGQEG